MADAIQWTMCHCGAYAIGDRVLACVNEDCGETYVLRKEAE